MPNLTDKETIELRIKCVEVFVSSLSRAGLQNDEAFTKGEKLWDFAVATLGGPTAAKKSKY